MNITLLIITLLVGVFIGWNGRIIVKHVKNYVRVQTHKNSFTAKDSNESEEKEKT